LVPLEAIVKKGGFQFFDEAEISILRIQKRFSALVVPGVVHESIPELSKHLLGVLVHFDVLAARQPKSSG
jgi:hypothetical protein